MPTAANNQSYWHSPSNRLQNADGPWGSRTYFYDGVGNRTPDRFRSLHERVRGRLYTYNLVLRAYARGGFEQLISRVITNSGTANGTLCVGASDAHPHPRRYFVHDLWGNVIAELTTGGAPSYLPAYGRTREYIYLPESEIAPTRQARAQVDRPIAVVDAVNTATPATLMVHVDHLNRPVRMTNAAKTSVWDVIYTPWGSLHSATGARPLGSPLAGQTLNTRFPGQWFQLESGLHYNWHRHYDPSLGRYTQPDPLGFVDGPSVYAYAKNNTQKYVDPDGRFVQGEIVRQVVRMCIQATIRWLFPPPPPPEEQPDQDCTPPEGTQCIDGPDFGRPHGSISPHWQLYEMRKKRNEGNKCEWGPVKGRRGFGGYPAPQGIPPCQAYPNWQRKRGGR